MTLYQLLEVTPDASAEDIKRSYRKLARTKHPDICKDGGADDAFKKINDAYETLIDEDKRKEYETALERAQTEEDYVPPVFQTMWERFFSKPFVNPHARPGTDLRITATFTVSDILTGGEKQLTYQADVVCNVCHGSGHLRAFSRTCPTCNGHHTNTVRDVALGGAVTRYVPCETCEGHGVIDRRGCMACNERGFSTQTQTITVPIPADVHRFPTLRMKGKGNAGRLADAGDLYVSWKQDPTDRFRIQGDDLYVKEKLSFYTAVNGGKVTVALPDGTKRECKIWPGTNTGDLESVLDDGLLNPKTKRRGVCYIEWRVQTPRGIDELKETWKEAKS